MQSIRTEVTTVNHVGASLVWAFLLRLALASGIVLVVILLSPLPSRAGGPKYVAGTSYFNSTATGQPLVWAGGVVTYYTDQGDLSPILPNATANTFVANAFTQWTGISTAAINVTSGGQLAEDVNGTNVYVNSNGSITMPADIQPSATGTPVGVVYDYDGSVTDALIGAGAGDSSQCFFNAVFGGDDNFGTTGVYQHALIVINGQCAQSSLQLVDVEYRLVRTIGALLGLGWSQANPNVLTGKPPSTSNDYAGFPVMHYTDPVSCVPITSCYPNPYQPSADDVASLSRLYPVTSQNQSSFPGTQIFSSTTARVHGSVWFTQNGNSTQPMQGVNVVARWIDPSTGQPSRQYVVTSVSGFLFTGNAGNPITGFDDPLGNPLSDWGSSSTSLEGFFDLAGLPLPKGGSAQYQLSVEGIDPTWSVGVGPYAPYQVAPSGTFQPIVFTVSAGQDVAQDILMSGSTQPIPLWTPSQTWTTPATILPAGDWIASLNGYGDEPYFQLSAKANRTLSISVTALDDSGNASESKAQPVIGMWAASDPQGTAPPALTPSAFNTLDVGMTQLNAQVSAASSFLIGIADLRGDGRPDYRYHASVLYADAVSPARLSVNGGALTLTGIGFSTALNTSIGNSSVTPLSVSAGQMILPAPDFPDGPQSLTVTNPASGASSAITDAVTYGAAASDQLLLLNSVNFPTAVGAQASNPVSVRVVQADGVTPVNGATVAWTATNGLQLSACGGASSCTVVSDQSGSASTWLVPSAVGVSIITATLAPGAYPTSQSVQATLSATESSSDLGVQSPFLWIAQGATVNVPLTARVLSNGVPQSSVTVNFKIAAGSGTLSAASAQTNSSGFATVTLQLTQFAGGVQISVCVAPFNTVCQQISVTAVPPAQLNLQPVAGASQTSAGQGFSPLVVRVVDSASPPHPILGAAVLFETDVLRPQGTTSGGSGETNPTNPGMPIILSVGQNTVVSDINGLASLSPSSGGFAPPLEIAVMITAGTTASLEEFFQLLPATSADNTFSGKTPPLEPPIREPWLGSGQLW